MKEFDVVIVLSVGNQVAQTIGEDYWVYLIREVKITVGRQETEQAPPDFVYAPSGRKVYALQQYLRQLWRINR